jgi:hypothetical protein
LTASWISCGISEPVSDAGYDEADDELNRLLAGPTTPGQE